MALSLRKATRQKANLRVGLSGPAGSGKTYSAILLAKSIASAMEKVAIIDTENGSADLYSHLGQYNVLRLEAPYSPERYIEAIEECEKAGMEVIIIDSVTHEWDGKGGCLESNELLGQTKFRGNNWAAWSVTTPKHQKFLERITSSPCHMITTARSKTDTIQTEDKKIKKVGLKEIQREGYEYELTVNFNVDREGHYAVASKDRTGIFIDRDPFVITEKTGQELKDWAEQGTDPKEIEEAEKKIKDEKEKAEKIAAIKQKIVLSARKLGLSPTATKEEVIAFILSKTGEALAEENFSEILGKLYVLVEEQAEYKRGV